MRKHTPIHGKPLLPTDPCCGYGAVNGAFGKCCIIPWLAGFAQQIGKTQSGDREGGEVPLISAAQWLRTRLWKRSWTSASWEAERGRGLRRLYLILGRGGCCCPCCCESAILGIRSAFWLECTEEIRDSTVCALVRCGAEVGRFSGLSEGLDEPLY